MHVQKVTGMLFQSDMAGGIWTDRKTMTRRLVKLPQASHLGVWEPSTCGGSGVTDSRGNPVPEHPVMWHTRSGEVIGCPYGGSGDLLYVREPAAIRSSGWNHQTGHWYCMDYAGGGGTGIIQGKPPQFFPSISHNKNGNLRWQPGIHMPRFASRSTLIIRDVRAQHLQDITEEECILEGCAGGHGSIPGYNYSATPLEHFRHVITRINGKKAWESNPWVWAISFTVVKVNIDTYLKGQQQLAEALA